MMHWLHFAQSQAGQGRGIPTGLLVTACFSVYKLHELGEGAPGATMCAKMSRVVFAAFLLANSAALAAEVELKVGETKTLGNKVQGAALDNPRIADLRILKDARVEVSAREDGQASLAIYTSEGKLQMYQVRVVGNPAKGTGASPASAGSSTPRFGGRKIPSARCAEPLENEDATRALQDARDLLRQEHVDDALQALERALVLEPDAAVLHLYLGSAWAKRGNDAKGAASYETYVLSCPDSPEAKPVNRLLQEFGRRSSSKPE